MVLKAVCILHVPYQGLLNKKPSDRLGWPELLDHPFVRETSEERLKREKALVDALEVADSSRAWRVSWINQDP